MGSKWKNCEQEINLVALQIGGRQLRVTFCGFEDETFSFGNLESKVPVEHPVGNVK